MNLPISEDNILFLNRVSNWRKSIEVAAQPLIDSNSITKQYVEAMIDTVNQMGEYIVLAPGVAMPHARPSDGVLKPGLSFLLLEEPVVFGENKKVNLIICLAAQKNSEHLEFLQTISVLIDSDKKVNCLINSKNKDAFLNNIKKILKEEN